jgi:hypothetical protein
VFPEDFQSTNIFYTLPSFFSSLVRIFYITQVKVDDYCEAHDYRNEDLYFNAIFRRFSNF